MKVAMISADEAEIPARAAAAVRAYGMELICRKCRTEDDLRQFAADADVLWLFGANPALTAAVLEQLPNCRALLRNGSGVDALPLAKAAELGILICSTPESIAESVAEHTVALLFALARRIPFADREVRQGFWDSSPTHTRWHLSGRTLGLIGYGHIARMVENMVSGFRMRVIHYDPASPNSIPLVELLPQADFISLHCPLTPATRHLIGAEEFRQMKPGALVVNTARGAIIDETALVAALRSGHLGGAALDVTTEEPLPGTHPLRQLENVIITPHMAAFSADFERNFWSFPVEKLRELQAMPISARQSR